MASTRTTERSRSRSTCDPSEVTQGVTTPPVEFL
jgi:hypothetical protein